MAAEIFIKSASADAADKPAPAADKAAAPASSALWDELLAELKKASEQLAHNLTL